MKLLGIKFSHLDVSLEKRLQTLAAAMYVYTFLFYGFTCLCISFYLILCTSFWLPTIFYLFWIWFVDKDTCEKGGRQFEWPRTWNWFKYFNNYFPAHLERLPGVELDPKRNYLFCNFPHGFISMSMFCAFLYLDGGASKLFPCHKFYCHTLKMMFFQPFARDLVLSVGGLSSSANSIRWCMRRPEGGRVSVLSVGGAAEAYNCRPGEYRIVLKNRKGFVKIALQTGAPLVPVFSFGETDLYDQVECREGSLLRRIQEAVKKTFGFAPIIPVGRGFFQDSFGIIPLRKPITVVVGKPIDVEINENPTQKDIDQLHKTFVDRLVELFESQKHKYLINPNDIQLIIE